MRPSSIAVVLVTLGLSLTLLEAQDEPLPEGAVARLGTTRLRHVGGVTTLCWLEADRLLSAGGVCNSPRLPPQVRLWEASSGRLLAKGSVDGMTSVSARAEAGLVAAADGGRLALLDPETLVSSVDLTPAGDARAAAQVALAPCGTLLAAGCGGDEVRLWDRCVDGSWVEREARLQGAWWMAFSDDGALFTASRNGAIRRWDVGNLEGEEIVAAVDDWAFPIALSRDGAMIAAAARDGRVLLWSVRGRRLLRALAGRQPVTTSAFSPDGRLVAWAEASGGVHVVEVGSGAEVARFDLGTFAGALAFSPDGRTLASGNATPEGAIRLWDVATRLERTSDAGHASTAETLEFSPDGRWVASTGDDRTVRIWEVSSGRCVERLGAGDRPARFLRFSPDGGTLVATEGGPEPRLRLWKQASGRWRGAQGPPDGLRGPAAILPDGRLLCIRGRRRTPMTDLWAWDSSNGTTEQVATGVYGPDRLETMPDGTGLLMFSWAAGNHVIDLLHPDARADGVSFWPWYYRQPIVVPEDEEVIVVAQGAANLRVFDLRAHGMSEDIATEGEVLAISRDARYFACRSPEGRVVLCETATGEQMVALPTSAGEAVTAAFSREGSMLATSLVDSTILLWPIFAAGSDAGSALDLDEEGLWQALAGDAPAAWEAVRRSAGLREAVVERIASRILQPPDPAWISSRILGLDAQDVGVREKTQAELEGTDVWVDDALQEAIDRSPSAEVRARAGEILGKRATLLPRNRELVQAIRAVALLERIGTPRAREVLGRVADGAPACVSREARGALLRLERREGD